MEEEEDDDSSNNNIDGGGIKQLLFESCEHVTSSDHKPVRSLFNVNIFKKIKPVQKDDSTAEKDTFVVEVFGLSARNLRPFDNDGTSDPYFHIYFVATSTIRGH